MEGDPTLLVWRIPGDLTEEQDDVQVFAIPVMSRQGGALLAVPELVLSAEALLDGALQETLLGPSKELTASLCVEDDVGHVVDLALKANFIVVDVDDVDLGQMREYDPVTDSTESIRPFSLEHVNALPKLSEVGEQIREWLSNVAREKLNFYSAQEDQEPPEPRVPTTRKPAQKKATRRTNAELAERLDALQAQVQLLTAAKQPPMASQAMSSSGFAGVANGPCGGPMIAKVPPLSAALQPGIQPKDARVLLGPPPKAKAMPDTGALPVDPESAPVQPLPISSGGDPMVNAMAQQSAALCQLVAHLASGGDPFGDLASGSGLSGGLPLSTKGGARREKMQNELANRSSNFFGQVQNQLFRRLHPSKPVPKSVEELVQSGVSMTMYLERHGGYRHARDTGYAQWILAHAFDAAAQEDLHSTREYLALLITAQEQSAMDGNWQLAYILSLMEDPPIAMFSERMQSMTATGRPFLPLVPPAWAAVALAYVKELDLLATRKTEMKKTTAAVPKAESDPGSSPSPKRKPRFPKKPKSGSEASP